MYVSLNMYNINERSYPKSQYQPRKNSVSNFTKSLQANIYMLKVNNRNTRKRCEIYSKSTIKRPERRE